VKTSSGLTSKVIAPGQGERKALATDQVTVDYSGWTTNGKLFDSTQTIGKPAVFSLANVIAGWRECVQLMTIGEKRRCWVPQELAYRGQAGRPAGMLVFDIELLGAEPSPTIAPPDVAKPPSDASRSASGLFYKVLKAGDGSRKPFSDSRVTVHYTGWTTDGKMFDSSVARNMPATFVLNEVIKGWTEGVQLMVEGEKRRFWIPESLAYAQGGGPRGMLVFDVELIRIER
jgi:peptidylprolyl isomerase